MAEARVAPTKQLQAVIENFITENNIDPEDVVYCPECKKFTVAECHLRAYGISRECYEGHVIE